MKLMADIDKNAGRTPFQMYTVQHGIETLEVLIPLGKSAMFDVQIEKRALPTKQSIVEFVKELGGEVIKG